VSCTFQVIPNDQELAKKVKSLTTFQMVLCEVVNGKQESGSVKNLTLACSPFTFSSALLESKGQELAVLIFAATLVIFFTIREPYPQYKSLTTLQRIFRDCEKARRFSEAALETFETTLSLANVAVLPH
jgi:hypothetical protein